MAEEIKIKITVDSDGVEKGVNKAKKKVGEIAPLGQQVGEVFKSSFKGAGEAIGGIFSGMTPAALGLAAGVAVVAGGFAFLKTAIGKSMEEAKEVDLLRNAIKATGGDVDKLTNSYKGFATTLERSSLFEGEEILKLTTYATQLGYSEEQTKKLIAVSADLAQSTGVSLDAAFTQLNGSLQGSAGSLAKQIPAIKDLTAAQLRSGEAIDIVATKMGGSAAAASKTFAGSLDQMSKRADDLYKSFGEVIVQSPEIQSAIRQIIPAIESLINAMGPMTKHVGAFLSTMASGVSAIAAIVKEDDKWTKTINEKNEALEDQRRKLVDLNLLYKENPGKWADVHEKETAKLKIMTKEYNAAVLARRGAVSSGELKTANSKNEVDEAKKSKPTFKGGGGNKEDDKDREARLKQEDEDRKKKLEQTQTLNNDIRALELANYAQSKDSALEAKLFKDDVEITAFDDKVKAMGEQHALEITMEEEKNLQIADSDLKLLEQKKTNAKAALFTNQETNKKELEMEKRQKAAKAKLLSDLASLMGSKNREMFEIGKAAAIAQATIATYESAVGAYKSLVGIPIIGPGLAVAGAIAATAAGFMNVSNIASTTLSKHAGGGIFDPGGNRISGDRNLAALDSKEMILNMSQQTQLFNRIKSGDFGGGVTSIYLERIAQSLEKMPAPVINMDSVSVSKVLADNEKRYYRPA